MNAHVTGFNITMIFLPFLAKRCLLAKTDENCQKLSKTDHNSETFKIGTRVMNYCVQSFLFITVVIQNQQQ